MASERSPRQPLVVPRDRNGTVRALFVGDSLTDGYFADSESQGFVSLMSDAIGGIELTTASRAHQTLTTVATITDVPPDLQLALIELGTNDVGLPTPLDQFADQYLALVERVRSASPHAALVCAGTWTGWGDEYDAVIESACAQVGGRYVALRTLFDDPANRGPEGRETFLGTSDDFHPNNRGHRAIADSLLAVLNVT